MVSLLVFPNPPPPGLYTVCEKNAELVTSPVAAYTSDQTFGFPDLNLSRELRKAFRMNETARSAFLEHKDSPRTRLLEAWYEHGLTGVLELLASADQPARNKYQIITSDLLLQFEWANLNCRVIYCDRGVFTKLKGVRVMVSAMRRSLWLVRMISNLQSSVFPHLSMSNDRLIAKFSTNPQWDDGLVRCFAWHPHTTKFAVAMHDDSISIHQVQPADIVPILKHKMQKGVADLAWKPLSASVLAVACHSCVLIWNVDPMLLSARPTASCVQVLSCPGHSPVIAIAWCPLDGILVSASPADNALMVWSTTTDSSLPIRRVGNGGVTLLKWSPDGAKLFTGCPSAMFRVWDCEDWTAEKWTKLNGRVQAACWSPNGCVLLFATSEEPLVYSIIFNEKECPIPANVASLNKNQQAVPLIDMSLAEKEMDGSETTSVGGIVQSMAWDSNGERLAVLCQGTSSFVALFQTRLNPTLEILPCGFIRGLPDEMATMISFKPQFSDGALLTVVWSTGRISHIPLYYTPRSLVGCQQDILFQQQTGYIPISTLSTSQNSF